MLHYDTAAQNEIGKRFAAKLEELRANKPPGNQPTDAP
jgi:hypothetical protein